MRFHSRLSLTMIAEGRAECMNVEGQAQAGARGCKLKQVLVACMTITKLAKKS